MSLKTVRKLGRCLSLACHDFSFRTFGVILLLKLFLFSYLTSLRIESYLAAFGGILFALSFSFLTNNGRLKFLYLLMLDAAISLILVSQLIYFKYFSDFFNIYNIFEINQIPAIGSSISRLANYEVLFLLDFPVVVWLYFRHGFSNTLRMSHRIIILTILAVTGLVCNAFCIIGKNNDESIMSGYGYAFNYGIINYHIHDVFYALNSDYSRKDPDKSELEFLRRQVSATPDKQAKNDFTGIAKGCNLIFIQVESMQNFVIGRKLNGKEITPNINGMIDSGIVFRNIYDQTAAGNSSDAMFLVNCSLYPSARGTVAFLYAKNRFDSLARLLSEHGYATMVLHAYYRNFWNFSTLDESLGFGQRHYQDDFAKDEMLGWGLSDRSFFAQSLQKIKKLPSPFFVVMRTLTTHDPFRAVTPEIDDFPVNGLGDETLGHYIRSMHYVDSAIGAFLRGLSDAGLLSNTVVVVYGDHSARLPEREMRQIGIHDGDEGRKPALAIGIPGWKKRTESDTVGGLIDLTPTVCNILGIDISGRVFLGNDLAGNHAGYVIFRNGSFFSPGGLLGKEAARRELHASDLLLETDCIPRLKSHTP